MAKKTSRKAVASRNAEEKASHLLTQQKQTQNRVWFKTKNYGWGWYPATWQAWLIVLADTALFATIGLVGWNAAETALDRLFYVFVPWVGLMSLSLAVSYHFGEKPHWQWGGKKKPAKS